MRIDTNKAVLTWSDDGATITKAPYGSWGLIRPLFRNERRVMRMLELHPPPVRVPRLVVANRHTLVSEAIDGEPLGPKFPTVLGRADVDDMVAMIDRIGGYRPRRRWFRRFEPDARLRAALRAGVLDHTAAAAVGRAIERHPMAVRFAHGDVTSRNVLRDVATGEIVLIDWEWSGWYPVGYDRAFFWFTLVDMPDERSRVACFEDPWFVLSATFVQLFHLGMWQGRGRPAHHETLAMLLDRVRRLA